MVSMLNSGPQSDNGGTLCFLVQVMYLAICREAGIRRRREHDTGHVIDALEHEETPSLPNKLLLGPPSGPPEYVLGFQRRY